MKVRAVTFAAALALGLGCGAEEALLVVELRTDFVLGPEVAAVELFTIRGPGTLSNRVETPQGDGLTGVRLIEASGVPLGNYHVRAIARRPDDSVLAETEAILSVDRDVVHTLLLTRDCAAAECPEDDPALAACVAGTCETPECAGGDESACTNGPECERASDCGSDLACGEAACFEGACVVMPTDCGAEGYCDPAVGCRASAVTTCDQAPYRDALVCLDFEDETGVARAEDNGYPGELHRSEDAAYESDWGLRASAGPSGGGRSLTFTLPEIVDSGTVHMRAQMRVRPDTFEVLEEIQASGARHTYITLLVLTNPDHWKAMSIELTSERRFQHYLEALDELSHARAARSDPDTVPVDEWICLQFEARLDEAEGATLLSGDEERLLGHANVRTLPAGGISELVLRVGQPGSDGTAASEVYFDDVVVDRSPIPCD